MWVFVSITQDDIDKDWSTACCPNDRAVMRKVVGDIRVATGAPDLLIHERDGSVKEIKLPIEIVRWVEDFDMYKTVRPISYMVDIPAKYLPKGVR